MCIYIYLSARVPVGSERRAHSASSSTRAVPAMASGGCSMNCECSHTCMRLSSLVPRSVTMSWLT